MTGQTGYFAGLAAEDIVAMDYASRGCVEVARRWRGSAGEVDLIVQEGETFIFVEVKKSASFSRAAARLSRRQMDRICMTATEYVARTPKGQLTDMRLDVALVNGHGAVHILENAIEEVL